MGGLVVVATTLRRQSTALISLSFACWIMTLLNPLTLWDVGFQLSSAATAGLILFSPGMTAFFDRLWPGFGQSGHLTGSGGAVEAGGSLLRGLIQDGLLVTLAANITTLPLVVHYFERLSVVSPLTNLLISPAQPFIMLWGGLGVILGIIGLWPLAQVILWIPYLSLWWTVSMVQWTAALPGANVEIMDYSSGALILTYAALALMRWRGWLRGRIEAARQITWNGEWVGKLAGNGALAGLSVTAFLVWRIVLTGPDGYLHVHFLDVGQGDGIFIQTPSGRQVLIDGGSDSTRLFSELGAVMPFWDRSLDLLVLTHPDLDHMGAQVTLPDRYRVDGAVVSAVTLDQEDGDGWEAMMLAAGVPISTQGAGGWIDLGDDVALWTLWPMDESSARLSGVDGDDKNERSLVQKLVYGELDLLLTGDAGIPAERGLVRQSAALQADILKVGHHGSNSSSDPAFVAAVNPSIAVIQVGENRYGHPTQEVLDTLAGRLILRNDLHGRIHLWSDGAQMWLEGERALNLWRSKGNTLGMDRLGQGLAAQR
jgi:competence protein ComEC